MHCVVGFEFNGSQFGLSLGHKGDKHSLLSGLDTHTQTQHNTHTHASMLVGCHTSSWCEKKLYPLQQSHLHWL